MKNRDKEYHARLTVYGLPSMDKRSRTRFIKWLRKQAKDIEANPVEYSENYVARLMK